ncbi:hypothetical protein A4G20_08050 [Pasteurellaceae bacterium RH1A]|nr:hypothetical protein A4G20_08050 [Pasteurellaceae bacterium RH1A]
MKTNATPLFNEFDDLRPLTDEELAQFRPLKEVMPPEFVEMVLKHQAEQESQAKQRISLNLSKEVIAGFQAMGAGWQNKIDQVLNQYLQTR